MTGAGWCSPASGRSPASASAPRSSPCGLREGRSGVGPITAYDTDGFAYANGCEVTGFTASDHLRTLDPAELGRATQFAAAAARMAVEDAGLDEQALADRRCLVSVGTTDGGSSDLDTLVEAEVADGARRLDPVVARRVPVGPPGRRDRAGAAAARRRGVHAADRLRRRQLRDRLRPGRDPHRRGRHRAVRRGGRGLPEDLRRLLPARHDRAGALPALRRRPQGHPHRRGRRHPRAGERRVRGGQGRPDLRRGARLRAQLRRLPPGRAVPGQRRRLHAAGARGRRGQGGGGRLHLRARHRHQGQRRHRGPGDQVGLRRRRRAPSP